LQRRHVDHGDVVEPKKLWASVARGTSSRARAMAGPEGREGAKDRVSASIDREPKAGASPRAPNRGGGRSRAQPGSFA
jgi:hypothetical protein